MEAKGDKGKGSKGGKGGRRDGAAIGELLPETNEEVKKEYENEFDVTAANSKFDKAAVATEGEEGGPVELSDGSGWIFEVRFGWIFDGFPWIFLYFPGSLRHLDGFGWISFSTFRGDSLKPLPGYDKTKSFFDSISCEATERSGAADRPKAGCPRSEPPRK